MYVYLKSEPELWTVGYYSPDGKWQSESDHGTTVAAAKRVNYLNGGKTEIQDGQYIVVYRPHGDLNNETQYHGPFKLWEEADDYLSSLPAVGYYNEEVHQGRQGVKFVQQLKLPGA